MRCPDSRQGILRSNLNILDGNRGWFRAMGLGRWWLGLLGGSQEWARFFCFVAGEPSSSALGSSWCLPCYSSTFRRDQSPWITGPGGRCPTSVTRSDVFTPRIFLLHLHTQDNMDRQRWTGVSLHTFQNTLSPLCSWLWAPQGARVCWSWRSDEYSRSGGRLYLCSKKARFYIVFESRQP